MNNRMRTIAVLGTGYVGLVSGACYADIGNRVICCDIDRKKIEQLSNNVVTLYEPGLEDLVRRNVEAGRLSFSHQIEQAIHEADIVYIAVGTPMGADGAANLTHIREAAATIGLHLNGYKIIVTKSTVPVGTNRLIDAIIHEHIQSKNAAFDVVSNPEFLREGSAIQDCMNMERAIIGAASDSAAQEIVALHEPFGTQFVLTDWESAEMIKYASNTFLATKISFVNALANLCERYGADIDDVTLGMGLDSRIGRKFLQAGIGYGGSCFPKDTYALKHMAETVGYDFRLLNATITTNHSQRQVILDKLEHALGSLLGRRIAVLGASFKPNTDDLREAPSLTVIPAVLDKGAAVSVYDPAALRGLSEHLGSSVVYCNDLYEAVLDSDAILILTEWEQITGMDLDRVQRLMRRPVIVDGRNCFPLDVIREKQIEYHSVGRFPVIYPASLPVQV